MKTIKVFLASSEELDYDRMAFGNLVRRLDDMYEKRGIRIKLFEWEDYDAAYNDKRKQDEYNENVKQSDIFLGLFYKKAGQFTVEEFDVASQEFKDHASPKVYTYCKELKPGEEETPELKEFKKRLFKEMGHYWCRYDNRESLQFQFVMQLQLVESSQMDEVKVEDGVVTINGLPVAKMENLKFAAANEDYLRMQTDIQELRKEIEEMQLDLEKKQRRLETKQAKLEENPDDEDCQEDYKEKKEEVEKLIDRLQPKLNKYNKLKEDFAKHQELLFNTAKRVTKLQGEEINDRIRRAIDALNEGLVREANTILNEAEEDAKNLLNEYKQSKEITEQKRRNLVISIKELSLKATSIMADASILISERFDKANKIYELADTIARDVKYDRDNYAGLLYDYANFSYEIGQHNKALELFLRQIYLLESNKNDKNTMFVMSYLGVGEVYDALCDYDNALKYYNMALKIEEEKQSNNLTTVRLYNDIGVIYHNTLDYEEAIRYYNKALEVGLTIIAPTHETIIQIYENLAEIYEELEDYKKSVEYRLLALPGQEREWTKNSITYMSNQYYYIAEDYKALSDHKEAFVYYSKSLAILERYFNDIPPITDIKEKIAALQK